MTPEQVYNSAYRKACLKYSEMTGLPPTKIQEAKAEYEAREAAFNACQVEHTEEISACHLAYLDAEIQLYKLKIEQAEALMKHAIGLEVNSVVGRVNKLFNKGERNGV